jgi:concanavalin A-like lectin/glucanase superfamily protein
LVQGKKRVGDTDSKREKKNLILKLNENIMLCKLYRAKTRKYINKLAHEYKDGKLSYTEYEYLRNRYLKGKSIKYWTSEYYKQEIKIKEYLQVLKRKKWKKQVPKIDIKFVNKKKSKASIIIGLLCIFFILVIILKFGISSGYGNLITGFSVSRQLIDSSSPEENPTLSVGETKVFSIETQSGLLTQWYINDIPVESAGSDEFIFSAAEPGTYAIKVLANDNEGYETKKWEATVKGDEAEENESVTDDTGKPAEDNKTIPENTEENESGDSSNSTDYEAAPDENITEELNLSIPDEVPDNPDTEENDSEPLENVTVPDNIPEGYQSYENITQDLNTTNPENETKTSKTIQGFAEIGKPVSWTKKIINENLTTIEIPIPPQAQNIKIKKVITLISTKTKADIDYDKAKLVADGIESRIQERTTGENNAINESILTIYDIAPEYEITYETPGPEIKEKSISGGKKINISSQMHYENILAYTSVSDSKRENIRLYHLTNGNRESIGFTATDPDNDGFIERIEWTIPHLSEQEYEVIIKISNAEHLNTEKEFISDVYAEVKEKDDVWSEPINPDEYLRITFQKPLDNKRDITIYAKPLSSTGTIEVYPENSDKLIASFDSIPSEGWHTVYLTSLEDNESYETFDLKIRDSQVAFDYIVDPAPTVAMNNPLNRSFTYDPGVNISVQVGDTDNDPIAVSIFVRNDTGYLDLESGLVGYFYGITSSSTVDYNLTALPVRADSEGLVLLAHFDNRSEYGENDSYIYDFSGNQNNLTCYISGGLCPVWNYTEAKFAGAHNSSVFDEFYVNGSVSLGVTDEVTLSAWIRTDERHHNATIGEIHGSPIEKREMQSTDDFQSPKIIHFVGDIFVYVYEGPSTDCWAETVKIKPDGSMPWDDNISGAFEFDTSCIEPDILRVSDNVVLVAYENHDTNDLWVETLAINPDGSFTGTIDSMEVDTEGDFPELIHVSGDTYAVVFMSLNADGWLATIDVDSAGNIAANVTDIIEFQADQAEDPEIFHVNGDVYGISYTHWNTDGWISTVTIDSSGHIGSTAIDHMELSTVGIFNCTEVFKVDDNLFVVAGEDEAHQIKAILFSVEDDGTLPADSDINDSKEFCPVGGGSQCMDAAMIPVGGDVYGVAYTDDIGTLDLWMTTLEILANGSIMPGVIDDAEINRRNGMNPHLAHVFEDIFVEIHHTEDLDLWLDTFRITAAGDVFGEGDSIDTFEFDPVTTTARHPDMIPTPHKNLFAMVYLSTSYDPWIATIEILPNGTIADNVSDAAEILDYTFPNPDYPVLNILHVQDDIYIVSYLEAWGDGWFRTYTISSDGSISGPIDSFEHDGVTVFSDMVHVAGNIFARVYESASNDGWIATVEVDSDGNFVGGNVTDIDEWRTSGIEYVDMIQVKSNTTLFAVAYEETDDGEVATLSIDSNGDFKRANAVEGYIDAHEFYSLEIKDPRIEHVYNDVYVVLYRQSATDDAWMSTFEIYPNGSISGYIDAWEYMGENGNYSDILRINNNVFALAYQTNSDDGHVSTFKINDDGTIRKSFLTSYEYDWSGTVDPEIVHIHGDVYAFIYGEKDGGDGKMETIKIVTDTGVSKRESYGIYTEDNTTVYGKINNVTISASLTEGWNHVALTYDNSSASNQIKLYVDSVHSASGSLKKGIDVNDNDFFIGTNYAGFIDDVAVWNRSLTQNEITELYNLSAGKYYWNVSASDGGSTTNNGTWVFYYHTFEIDCGSAKCLYVYDSSENNVSIFDSYGNLYIGGSFTESVGSPSPDGTDFIIKDSADNEFAWIDDATGNMEISGTLDELNGGSCAPGSDAFIIRDGNDNCVSYLDVNGNLWLKGQVKEDAWT